MFGAVPRCPPLLSHERATGVAAEERWQVRAVGLVVREQQLVRRRFAISAIVLLVFDC